MAKILILTRFYDSNEKTVYYEDETYEVADETVTRFKKLQILGGERPKAELLGKSKKDDPDTK